VTPMRISSASLSVIMDQSVSEDKANVFMGLMPLATFVRLPASA